MLHTCFPVIGAFDLENPGGSRICAVDFGGLGKGVFRAVTHSGSGRGGKPDFEGEVMTLTTSKESP